MAQETTQTVQSGARSARQARRARRQQAIEARRRAEERAQRQRLLVTVGAAVLATTLIAGIAYWLVSSAAAAPGQPVADIGNTHIQQPEEPAAPYSSEPPTSGPHWGSLAPWGVHDRPWPAQLLVHNLEDGGVVVYYHCSAGCPQLVEQLQRVVQSYPDHVLLVPYAPSPKATQTLDKRIALTAWARLDKFDDFDEARIRRFVEAYRCIDHHVGRSGQRIPTCR